MFAVAGEALLVRQEVDFVQPDVVGLLLIISVHLESDVDLFLKPVRLRCVIGVDGIALICDRKINVMHLVPDTFEMPDEMDPRV